MAIKIKTTSKKSSKKVESQNPPLPVGVRSVSVQSTPLSDVDDTDFPEAEANQSLPERSTVDTPYKRQGMENSPLGAIFSPRTPPPLRDASTPLASLLPKLGDVSSLLSVRPHIEQRLDHVQSAATADPDAQVEKRASEALMLKQVLQWLSLGEAKD